MLLHYHKLYQWYWNWTHLNMSQETTNPKQDICILRRLRLDFAVRAVWSASSLNKPWVLGLHAMADRDSGKIWVFPGLTYCFVCVGQQPTPRSPRPASPHFSHFRFQTYKAIFLSPNIYQVRGKTIRSRNTFSDRISVSTSIRACAPKSQGHRRSH